MNSLPERKKILWAALSVLCLDTEHDDITYASIARTIREQDFTLEEAEQIAFEEVFPVLYTNIMPAAIGVWAGFDQDWLAEEITKPKNWYRRQVHRFDVYMGRRLLKNDWEKVREEFKR